MRSAVVVLIGMATAAHADRPDPVAAERLVMEARSLARDGQCAAALRLRPEIDARDVDAWPMATSEDPRLAACVVAVPPHEDAAGGPSSIAPTSPPPSQCTTTGYLEPSLLFAPVAESGRLGVIDRIATGLLVRSCTSPYHARLGGTMYASNIGAGLGFEAELSHRVGDWHIGGHVALETLDNVPGFPLRSIDLRVHFLDTVWVQLGMYSSSAHLGYGVPARGVAAGVGIEAKPGKIVAWTELGIASTLAGLVIYAFSQGGFR